MIVIKWTRIWLLKYVKGDKKNGRKEKGLGNYGGGNP